MIQLRDYQIECIDILDNKGQGRYLVQMATGLGKTVTFANIRRQGRMLILFPNERKCSQIQGRQLKLQGVKSGVPDLHLPVARGEYLSLYIELKAEKGKVSDNQNWWITELQEQGNKCVVCHGWEEAVKSLEEYLCGQRK